MATLHLVQGPAGGGKTAHSRRLIEAGQAALQADITAIYTSLTGVIRDARTGKYPDRVDGPELRAAIYLQSTIARYAYVKTWMLSLRLLKGTWSGAGKTWLTNIRRL